MTVSLVVVEHPPAVLQSLLDRLSIERDLRIVGETSHTSAAVDLTRLHQPDVVLLDAEMPNGDVPAMVQALTSCHPTSAVVILTINPAGARTESPAVTVVGKHQGIPALLAAIRAAGGPDRHD